MARTGTPADQDRREQIEDSFSGVSSRQQFLERTSHVLALISNGVGVALAASADFHALEHIHFSRLCGGESFGGGGDQKREQCWTGC